MERTRRTARPRTAGTACSSWPEGVPRDFSLEASKAPVLFHQKWCFLGCLLVLAWGETTNRTMADGREWYSCRTIRCGSGSWQDCGAGLWNRRQAHGVLAVQRQYSFRRQPEVTQRGKGVTTQTCFLPRGRRAQARSVGEGASPCQANLGVFHGRLLRRGVRAKGAGPSGRNKPAGFPLTFCLFVCLFVPNPPSHNNRTERTGSTLPLTRNSSRDIPVPLPQHTLQTAHRTRGAASRTVLYSTRYRWPHNREDQHQHRFMSSGIA